MNISCHQETILPETEETVFGGGGSSIFLDEVLSIDYDRDNNNYYVVGISDAGDIDVW